ncbi:hypothetical protein ACQPYH_23100 [Kribbella sp. CA-245084]|uniref:hypothetical protein n=1 Tax=Kribbella sp. CA-245084 TaxID=3239940 RepID=UPI003D910711
MLMRTAPFRELDQLTHQLLNLLTVKAERRPPHVSDDVERQVAERSFGVFSRQLFLGEHSRGTKWRR